MREEIEIRVIDNSDPNVFAFALLYGNIFRRVFSDDTSSLQILRCSEMKIASLSLTDYEDFKTLFMSTWFELVSVGLVNIVETDEYFESRE